MESITLTAPDISCAHCQNAIESTLGKLEGVQLAKVDIPSKTVAISYDSQKLSQAKLEEALDDIGYTVQK
ncbi:MAG TPA: heavy-metal-associated domain-containing protein [Ktedonobacteraceae bacterium]|nr:heavy-metal-associated domain-containing protein [Ktedonobacteraceae bacterium]